MEILENGVTVGETKRGFTIRTYPSGGALLEPPPAWEPDAAEVPMTAKDLFDLANAAFDAACHLLGGPPKAPASPEPASQTPNSSPDPN